MQILICADAGPEIGTGHIRRMLTLADALVEQGADVDIQTSELGQRIVESGDVKAGVLCAPCSTDSVKERLRQKPYEAVVLDNYHWDGIQEKALRPFVPFIAVVDDLADRPHDVDLLLDQNAHHAASDYDGLLPDDCIRLVGGDYCLLARAFRVAEHAASDQDDAPVFVSLGGGDPHNDLVAIVRTLLEATDKSLTIATGSHIEDAETLGKIALQHPERIDLVFDSQRVAGQMQASQFAVAAAGTMTWERACLGLPSLCLVVADNQIDSADWLADNDVHTVFDLRGGWSQAAFEAAVKGFADDHGRRNLYAQKSCRLVARDGAFRVARTLLDSTKADSKIPK